MAYARLKHLLVVGLIFLMRKAYQLLKSHICGFIAAPDGGFSLGIHYSKSDLVLEYSVNTREYSKNSKKQLEVVGITRKIIVEC